MGSGQSTEREVTVEERDGEDGQPQIVVTQDFLQYVQERQKEEDGEEGEERGRPSPPPYPSSEDIPQLTTDDMISSAFPGSRGGEGEGSRGGEGGGRREESVWKSKYEMEREKNSELKHATDNEFEKTVAEIRDKFAEANVLDMLPVCEDVRNEVLQCYHSNQVRPLLCSSEVRAFSSCVERARQKLLHSK